MKYTRKPWYLDETDGSFEIRTEPGHQNGLLLATVHHQGEDTFGNAVIMAHAKDLLEKAVAVLTVSEDFDWTGGPLGNAIEALHDLVYDLMEDIRAQMLTHPEPGMSTKPAPGTCCPDMEYVGGVCKGCGTKEIQGYAPFSEIIVQGLPNQRLNDRYSTEAWKNFGRSSLPSSTTDVAVFVRALLQRDGLSVTYSIRRGVVRAGLLIVECVKHTDLVYCPERDRVFSWEETAEDIPFCPVCAVQTVPVADNSDPRR